MPKAMQAPLVAVVEDDLGVREATQSLLQSTGFATHGFATAEQFLRSRSGRRAACLIVDLTLPGIGGLELQERLQAQGVDLPIIVITAIEDRAGRVRARALRAGAVTVLRKPFRDRELLDAVRRALTRP